MAPASIAAANAIAPIFLMIMRLPLVQPLLNSNSRSIVTPAKAGVQGNRSITRSSCVRLAPVRRMPERQPTLDQRQQSVERRARHRRDRDRRPDDVDVHLVDLGRDA